MSVWFSRQPAAAVAKRSVFPGLPMGAYFASASSSFADVNLSMAESSLQRVAMWSSVDLIASLCSELPIDVFKGTGRDRVAKKTPEYLKDPAGDGYGAEDWTSQLLMSWLLRGNVYGDELDWDRRGGFPTQISLFHPDTVSGYLDDKGKPVWTAGGREPKRMWHRRVYPTSGVLQGLSPVAYHATTIGLGLTAGKYGLQWFKDGAHPSSILQNEEVELDPKQVKTAKERFMAALWGSREPVVLGKGWKYQQIQIAPNESQFLETQNYTDAQCARIFGPGMAEILGYGTGTTSITYANVESQSVYLLVYALNKWLRRTERVYTSMLPVGEYARLNRSALLESTALDRWRVHEIALRTRAKVVNEVRDDEDMGPVKWGAEPNPVASAVGTGKADPEKGES